MRESGNSGNGNSSGRNNDDRDSSTNSVNSNRPRAAQAEVSKSKEKAKKKRLKNTVALAGVLICVISGGGTFLYSQMNGVSSIIEEGGIYPNITIDGVNVTALSIEEAVTLLEDQYGKTIEGKILNYTYEDQVFPVTLDEIGWKYHVEEAVQKAYDIARTGTKKEITQIIKGLEDEPVDIVVLVDYDVEKLEAHLADIESQFSDAAVDAKMEKVGNDFVVTPDVSGLRIDTTATLHNTMEYLELGLGDDIPLVVTEQRANIVAEDFNFEKELIGAFTTSYSMSQSNRTNLEVGSKYLDGTIIMPNETFSAAEGMGKQTAERGYVSAGVFVGGKLTNGMGGGICQVSTTMYNAAIMAELEIVERSAHSMPVGYIPLGRDAAIADGYKDLVIKNDTEHPIYLEAYARDGVLAVNFYGVEIHEAGRTVSFETVLVSTGAKPAEIVTLDPNKYEDERVVTYAGVGTRNVTVNKIVKQDGKEISNEVFAKSTYRSMADEVTVGTKVREATTPEPSTDTTTNENTNANENTNTDVSVEGTTSDTTTVEPTPDVAPESVPEVTPEVAPEPAPEAVPEVAPEPVPEVTPEPVPEVVPEVVPEPTPEPAPAVQPEPLLEDIPAISTGVS